MCGYKNSRTNVGGSVPRLSFSTANISTLFETANKKGEIFAVGCFVVRTNNIFGEKSCGVFADLLHLQCN